MLLIGYTADGASLRQANIGLTILTFAVISFFYVLTVIAAGIDIVNLISPADNDWINGTNDTIAFTFNYTGENETASCELFLNDAGYYVNGSVLNETDTTMYANDTLSEGTYSWYVNCTNTTTVNSTTWTLNVDRTAPTVAFIFPANNTNTTNSSIDFQFNVTDNLVQTLNCSLYINSTFITYNATTVNATTTNFTISVSAGLAQNWTVNCTDSIGHYHQPTARPFNMDQTPPSLTIYLPQATNYSTNESLSLNYTLSDNYQTDSCWYNIDGGTNNTISGCSNTTFNTTGEDTFTLYLYANDSLDNMNNTESVTFTVDLTDPTSQFGTNPVNSSNESSSSVTFDLRCYDNVGVDTIQLWSDWTGPWSANQTNASYNNDTTWSVQVDGIPAGTWHWAVYCNDTSARSDWTNTNRTVSVDTTLPSVSITYPSNMTYYNVTYFNFTVSETAHTCWHSNGTVNTTFSCGNETPLYLTEGTKTLEVYANDSANNIDGDTVYFTLDQTDPSVSESQPIDNYNTSSQTVAFNFSVTDNLNSTTSCTLYIAGAASGTNTSVLNDTTTNITNTSVPVGTNSWYVNCTDGINTDQSGIRTINVDQTPPSVTLHLPTATNYSTNESLSLNYTAADSNLDSCWYNTGGSNNTITDCLNATFNTSGEESFTLYLYANDSANNINSDSVTFTVDLTNPTPYFGTNPVNNSNESSSSVTFELSCYDNVGVDTIQLWSDWTFSWTMNQTNSSYINDTTWTIQVQGIPDGNWLWAVYCNDSSGRYDWTNTNRTVNVDTQTPSVSITYPSNTTYYNVTYFNFTVVEANLDTCWHSNGTVNTTFSCGNETPLYLTEGTKTLEVYANDSANNIGGDSVSFTLDQTEPDITIIYPSNATINNDTFNFTYSDVNCSWYSVDGGSNMTNCSITGNSWPGTLIALTDGFHNVTVWANDSVGNTNSTLRYWARDTAAPAIYATYPANYSNISTTWINITGTASDPNGDTVTINDTIFGSNLDTFNSWNFTNTSMAEGFYSVLITATDTLSQQNSTELHFRIDRTEPAVSITYPLNTTYYNTTHFNFSASDQNPDSCWYNTDGSTNTTIPGCQNNTLLSLSEGTQALEVYANDSAGNIGSDTISFTLDQTPPSVSESQPIDNYNTSSQTVAFNFSVTDNLNSTTSCTLYIAGAASGTNSSVLNDTTTNITNTSVPAGSNSWYANCTDGINTGQSGTRTINVDITTPSVTITYPLNTTYYNTTHFNFSASDQNPDSCWYNTDGSTNTTIPSCQNNTALYLLEGQRSLQVYANDSAGNIGGDTISFTLDQTEPEITIVSPDNDTYPTQVIYFNVSLDENASWCGYSLDGTANESMTKLSDMYFWDVNISVPDGTHNVTFSCNDTVNNMNMTVVRYFTVDTDIPVLTITYPANTTYYNASYYNFTFTKTTDTCWYNLNGGGNTTVSCDNNTAVPTQEGPNTLEVYANDSLDNIADDIEYFTNDWTDPVVSLLYPADNYNTSQGSIDFQFNVTDNVSTTFNCSLFINNTLITYNTSTLNSSTTNFTVSVSVTLDQNWTINCTDEGDNSNQSTLRIFNIDQTPPSVSIYLPQPTNYSDNNTIPLNYTVSDNIGIHLCWYNVGGGTNYTTGCSNTTFNVSGEETFTLYFYVNDTSGNINNTEYVTFDIDMTAPAVIITYPLNTTYYNVTYFNFTLSETADTCWYNTDGGSNTSFSCGNNTAISLAEGQRFIEVYANDSVDNIGGDAVYFTLDQTGPDITFQLPTPDNQTTTANYTYINMTISESGYCLLDWNGTNESMSNATQAETYFVNNTLITNGNYTFTTWCNDTTGNLNQSQMRWVYINWTVPPPPDLTPPLVNIIAPVNDTTGNKTLLVLFGEVVNWSAYSIDGGNNMTQGAVPFIYFEMGTSDGPHNITVYANDSSGNMNSSTRYWIQDTDPPDIYNVTNESIAAISAVIRWNTTEAANSSVSYGTAVSMLNESSSSASLTQGHGLTIQTLIKNTTYYYNVTSCDNITNCNTSGSHSFKTPECTSNWECGAWSSCSGGQQTRTCTDANQCQYPWTYHDTQSCVDSPGGGRGTTAPQNVTTQPELVPGVGIINNTRLQDAIEMVLERANLSETAMDNLMRLSKSITQNVSAERNMYFSGTTTKLKTTIKYYGKNNVKNFMVFEKVPKTFASSASNVNISAPGASIEVVEEDPSWLITWPEVTPGDELSITYETLGRKSSTVPGSTETEIYAESLEEITEPAQQVNITEPVSCTPLAIRCHGKEVQQCSTGGDAWTVLETCDNECDPQTLSCALEPDTERPGFSFDMIPVIIILVIVLFVVIVFMGAKSIKRGKKPRSIPEKREEPKKKEPKTEEKPKPVSEKKEETKEKPLLHSPEEISKGIKDGEPDVALADIEIVRKAAPEKHLENATKKTPLKKPVTKKPKKTVKKEKPHVKEIPRYIMEGEPDIVMVTLSDIHRIAKKRKKKEKPPKKIADTDARLKKIGKVAFEMPKMRLNLEALMGDAEEHEKTITETRESEDSLHGQIEEITDSLSGLRSHLAEKMEKKRLQEKDAIEKNIIEKKLAIKKNIIEKKESIEKKRLEEEETDRLLEKATSNINTKVNIMTRNLDDALERLGRRIDESSKVGKLQMESSIGYLRNQIEELRSELPEFAKKKELEKMIKEKPKAKKKKVKRHRKKKPKKERPAERREEPRVEYTQVVAPEPQQPEVKAAEEPPAEETVKISDLSSHNGKEVILDVQIELTKTVEEEGTRMYGYNLKDDSGEVMMTSTTELKNEKMKLRCVVNETGSGKVYLRFVEIPM